MATFLKYTPVQSVGEGMKLPAQEGHLLVNDIMLLFNNFASITAGVPSNAEYGLLLQKMNEATQLQGRCAEKGLFCAFFGSARLSRETAAYKLALKAAYLIVLAGFGIITGAGPSIMEAANKGAHMGGTPSAGVHIILPNGQKPNRFPSKNLWGRFHNFFLRR